GRGAADVRAGLRTLQGRVGDLLGRITRVRLDEVLRTRDGEVSSDRQRRVALARTDRDHPVGRVDPEQVEAIGGAHEQGRVPFTDERLDEVRLAADLK